LDRSHGIWPTPTRRSRPRPRPELLARFETLIEARFATHQPVADYAAALGVSPTHLSRVCRAATGRPASALIQDRLIREARRNLVYTNLSVSAIAYALGFSDPAYFSRVFARATGLPQRAFRDRAQTARAATEECFPPHTVVAL